jgi:hypothetical protein
LRKLHRKTTRAEVAPELLAEQQFDIGLIINHENEKAQVRSPEADRFRDASQ